MMTIVPLIGSVIHKSTDLTTYQFPVDASFHFRETLNTLSCSAAGLRTGPEVRDGDHPDGVPGPRGKVPGGRGGRRIILEQLL